ncbi:Mce protein [Mycobacterium sp. 1274756.6]|uniref:Mce protein n=1 Tax=Mycobacterium sp. 1274756.6 TaxID=1834076 RepID=UPI0007FC8251|nr:Mce protein [Mycobacterium sp. 1274756.6]OBJ69436.1 Mce protein [Mycobacterium sp. 1274756.6]
MSKRSATQDVFDQLVDDTEPESPPADADADSTAETAATTPDPAPPPAAGTGRRWLQAVVAVVLVGALAAAGYLGWRYKQLHDIDTAAQQAVAAARDYAEVLTTLDAKDIDAHYNEALDGATGRFKDEYSQGASQLRQILIDNDAAGTGVVLDAAVKSASTSQVEVLLFVDQSITNAVNPSPRIDRNRIQMTMKLVDGRWLASNVDLI